MEKFKGKVAVVTGAASGIGRGIANRCAAEGMHVVLADVERDPLAQVEEELMRSGAEVLSLQVDVSKSTEVEGLALKALERFGAVHLLFNNAGIATIGPIWENTLEDCQWVIGVNLWGVIHGLRAFVPIMLKQETECHIVNTASMAGLMSSHPSSTYQLTKHAVVALSENVYHALAELGAKIKVSVLCPGWVNTRILESERNRPAVLHEEGPGKVSPENPEIEAFRQVLLRSMSPEVVAEHVFKAICEEKFYILTHPDWKTNVKVRLENIIEDRNPIPDVIPM
jgi:NAD(P)-dependent dehydrogenase (short-subunit alcohol dehydrogenase family)